MARLCSCGTEVSTCRTATNVDFCNIFLSSFELSELCIQSKEEGGRENFNIRDQKLGVVLPHLSLVL